MTLMTGATASSRQRSGRPRASIENSGGRFASHLLEHRPHDDLHREVANDQAVGEHDGAGHGQDPERVPGQAELPGGEGDEGQIGEHERVLAHASQILDRERGQGPPGGDRRRIVVERLHSQARTGRHIFSVSRIETRLSSATRLWETIASTRNLPVLIG